jgi:hypothetical protein
MVPTERSRFIAAPLSRDQALPAGAPAPSPCCSGGGKLLHVEAVEIDRFEQQRREAGIAHGIGDHAAGEGEQDARRFGIGEGVLLRLVQVAHADQAAIGQVDA